MKKEHYEYVVSVAQQYPLERWLEYNVWSEAFRRIDVKNDLFVEFMSAAERWAISTMSVFVFEQIETEDEASRILKLLKDTEVLFM